MDHREVGDTRGWKLLLCYTSQGCSSHKAWEGWVPCHHRGEGFCRSVASHWCIRDWPLDHGYEEGFQENRSCTGVCRFLRNRRTLTLVSLLCKFSPDYIVISLLVTASVSLTGSDEEQAFVLVHNGDIMIPGATTLAAYAGAYAPAWPGWRR
jgi:hypothetical protein